MFVLISAVLLDEHLLMTPFKTNYQRNFHPAAQSEIKAGLRKEGTEFELMTTLIL